jgi:hypothetical protein
MSKVLLFFACTCLTGCVTDYYKNKDIEYRVKILEKRMTLLELDIDEALDVCP